MPHTGRPLTGWSARDVCVGTATLAGVRIRIRQPCRDRTDGPGRGARRDRSLHVALTFVPGQRGREENSEGAAVATAPLTVLVRYSAPPAGGGTSSAGGATVPNTPPRSA